MFDAAAPVLRPLVRTLAEAGVPPPEDIGLDISVRGRVVATVELSWTTRQLCLALPGQMSGDRPTTLERAGWRVIIADPTNLSQAEAAVHESFPTLASPTTREGNV